MRVFIISWLLAVVAIAVALACADAVAGIGTYFFW